MKAIGRMIKLMVKAYMCMQMEPNMKVIGKTINSMEQESNLGQMDLFILANSMKEKNKEEAN